MGDYHYHDNYLKKVLLLVYVFGKFINTCLNLYCLDPCHPCQDAMLKMNVVKLEKIFDIDLYLCIEK